MPRPSTKLNSQVFWQDITSSNQPNLMLATKGLSFTPLERECSFCCVTGKADAHWLENKTAERRHVGGSKDIKLNWSGREDSRNLNRSLFSIAFTHPYNSEYPRLYPSKIGQKRVLTQIPFSEGPPKACRRSVEGPNPA